MNSRSTLAGLMFVSILFCTFQCIWVVRGMQNLRQQTPDADAVPQQPMQNETIPLSNYTAQDAYFNPLFPKDLLNIMQSECLSALCAYITENHDEIDFDAKLQILAKSDPAFVLLNHKTLNGWRDTRDVIDISNAAVDETGDVAVCTSDNKVSSVFGSYGCKETVSSSSNQCDPVVPFDKVIVISQMWGEGYFHYIVEDLPRFFLALDYLAQHNESLDQWYVHHKISPPVSHQSALLMGVKGTIDGYVRANRVLLPRSSPCGGSMSGGRIRRLRSLIHTRFGFDNNAEATKLIVFKRIGRRSIQNHDSIMSEASRLWKAGPVSEHAGEGSFIEQTQMYFTVAVLIGPHGSGLTNMISMRAGSTIVEILPEKGGNRLNTCYVSMAYALGCRYYALRAPGYDSEGVGYLPIESLTRLPIWNH